jgi:CMP/dCMP kinase
MDLLAGVDDDLVGGDLLECDRQGLAGQGVHLGRHVPAEALAELMKIRVDLPGPTGGEHDESEALTRPFEDGLDGRLDHDGDPVVGVTQQYIGVLAPAVAPRRWCTVPARPMTTSPDAPRIPTAVSLAGHVGSGKSLVSRLVSERLGWRRVSTGAMFREIASRHGMSVLELNRHAETHPEIDDEVDGHLRHLASSTEGLVIDSRMAWHFVPASFKVYLVVDPVVGAERVLGAGRDDERYETLEDAARANTARQEAEADRYHTLYGVRRDDWTNYDLIVDTTDISADTVTDIITEALEAARSDGIPSGGPDCLLSARRLVPTDPGEADPSGATIDIAVYGGTPFIVAGHGAVAQALRGREALVRCSLVRYDPTGEELQPPEGHVAHGATPEMVATWEREHSVSLIGLPSWLSGEQDSASGAR